MHNVSHLPYNTEVLTFIAFAHFFVFWIIRKNVNTVFITLKSFYKGCSPVVDGIDSVCTVVAQVIIKNDVVIKKGWLHGVTANIGCTHVRSVPITMPVCSQSHSWFLPCSERIAFTLFQKVSASI